MTPVVELTCGSYACLQSTGSRGETNIESELMKPSWCVREVCGSIIGFEHRASGFAQHDEQICGSLQVSPLLLINPLSVSGSYM